MISNLDTPLESNANQESVVSARVGSGSAVSAENGWELTIKTGGALVGRRLSQSADQPLRQAGHFRSRGRTLLDDDRDKVVYAGDEGQASTSEPLLYRAQIGVVRLTEVVADPRRECIDLPQ